jgi:hypothetical protein
LIRAWRCAQGHALGGLVYHSGVWALYLFRTAQVMNGQQGWAAQELLDLPLMGGPLVGTFYEIECSICGEKRSWYEDAKRKSG